MRDAEPLSLGLGDHRMQIVSGKAAKASYAFFIAPMLVTPVLCHSSIPTAFIDHILSVLMCGYVTVFRGYG